MSDQTAEQALAEANDAIAHAARLATLGELMASITHEVNQPLAAIVTDGNAALRWLNRQPPNVEEANLAIGRVIAEGLRASEIIARTRKLATKGGGERTAFDVNAMVEESIAITQRQVSGSGARILTHLSPDLPLLVADRVQIQQVVINLLVNAAQAMVQASSPVRELLIRTSQGEEGISIEVSDTGPGVRTEDEQQLFNAFFTTRPDGMGMGLSVARSIVEAHGGRIMFVPGRQEGAAFRVNIPVSEQAAV